jgi:hypothetical protein
MSSSLFHPTQDYDYIDTASSKIHKAVIGRGTTTGPHLLKITIVRNVFKCLKEPQQLGIKLRLIIRKNLKQKSSNVFKKQSSDKSLYNHTLRSTSN